MKNKIEAYAKEIETAYHTSPFWSAKDGKPQNYFFSVTYGRKFAKILMTAYGQKSVHCFVDIATGDIHKAGTWSQPQKNGLRGNVNNLKKPLFTGDFYVNK